MVVICISKYQKKSGLFYSNIFFSFSTVMVISIIVCLEFNCLIVTWDIRNICRTVYTVLDVDQKYNPFFFPNYLSFQSFLIKVLFLLLLGENQ